MDEFQNLTVSLYFVSLFVELPEIMRSLLIRPCKGKKSAPRRVQGPEALYVDGLIRWCPAFVLRSTCIYVIQSRPPHSQRSLRLSKQDHSSARLHITASDLR